MAFSTLGDWVGKWKQLKNWVLQRSDTVPSDIVEGGFYYDNTSKKPMYYDGTQAKPMGVTNHNDLSLIDGGDPTFRGHTTSAQAGYLNNAGSSNGVAILDSNGYLPIGNIPASLLGAVRYQGTWNPSTNTPTLVTPPSSVTKGYYYVASAVGTWDGKTFAIGDWIISNGTTWERVDNVDAISSVFGRTGAVVATSGDYTAAQVTNTPSGNISATTVQAALNELDTEKASRNHASTAASYGVGNASYYGHVKVDAVPTDGSMNAVSSDGVFDAIANISSSTPYPAYASTESGAGAYNMFRFMWPVNTGNTYDVTVVEISTYRADYPTDMGIMQIQLSVSYEGGTFKYRAETLWHTPEMAGRGMISYLPPETGTNYHRVYIGVWMESYARNSAGRVVSSVNPSARTVAYYYEGGKMGGASAINTGIHTLKLLSKGSNSFINAYIDCPVADTGGDYAHMRVKSANTSNGVELVASADGRAIVQSYDRDNNLYKPLVIAGTDVRLDSTGFILMSNQGNAPMLRFDPAYMGGTKGFIEYRDNGDGTPRALTVECEEFAVTTCTLPNDYHYESFRVRSNGYTYILTPPTISTDNIAVTAKWVKDVAPQLGSGFSAGTKIWFGSLASKANDGNTLYFCY